MSLLSNLKILRIVIWKNYILLKRHWIFAFFEIIGPGTFMVAALLLSSKFDSQIKTGELLKKMYQMICNNKYYVLHLRFDLTNTSSDYLMTNIYKSLEKNFTEIQLIPIESENNHLERVITFYHRVEEVRVLSKVENNKPLNLSDVNCMTSIKFFTKMVNIFLEIKTEINKPLPKIEIESVDVKKNRKDANVNIGLLPILTVFSFMFLCPGIIQLVVEEKDTGIIALIKVTGAPVWVLWLGWYLLAFILTLLIVSIKLWLLIVVVDLGPILKSDLFLVFLFLVLYYVASIGFCFTISSFFTKPSTAKLVGILIWITSYMVPRYLLLDIINLNFGLKIFLLAFPNAILYYGYCTLFSLETEGIGVQRMTLFGSPHKQLAFIYVILILLLDSAIYFSLTLYLNKFLFSHRKSHIADDWCLTNFYNYIFKRKVRPVNLMAATDYKRESPPDLEAGVQIQNLYKYYGSKRAINNLSIDMYNKEITALLGLSGAGKSSLISILAGITSFSIGSIRVNNYNIKTELNKVRVSLGFCPQETLLFSTLTVLEHLIFFGVLKRMSKTSAINAADILLQRLDMENQKHFFVSQLSSGMKRKLGLAIAITGNPKILLLDEPTVDLDPESCRSVWDLLLSIRTSRMIIFSTQSILEADILADRVAIINKGTVFCYGSSEFLKKEFGIGYQLTIVFRKDKVESTAENIIQTVTETIPESTLQYQSESNMTFGLPFTSKPHFGDLFEALENNANQYGISNINLSTITLQEMFLRIENAWEQALQSAVLHESHKKLINYPHEKLKGFGKIVVQFKSLIYKRYLIEKRQWLQHLVDIFILITAVLIIVYLSKKFLDVAYGTKNTKFLFSNSRIIANDSILQKYKDEIKNVVSQLVEVPDVRRAIKQESVAAHPYKGQLTLGNYVRVNSKNEMVITGLYPVTDEISGLLSLKTSSTALLRMINSSDSITFLTTPLRGTPNAIFMGEVAFSWSLLFQLALIFYCRRFLIFPISEIVSSVKHLQMMCGVSSTIYWTACAVWDMFIYMSVAVSTTMLINLFYYISIGKFGGGTTLFAIMLSYGCSVIFYSYSYSIYHYNNHDIEPNLPFTIRNFFHCYVITFIVMGIRTVNDLENFSTILLNLFCIVPQFGLSITTINFALKTVENYVSPKDYIEPKLYFNGKHEISSQLLIMCCSTFLYIIILSLQECHFTRKWFQKLLTFSYKSVMVEDFKSDETLKETYRVSKVLNLEKTKRLKTLQEYSISDASDLLLVHNLHKMFDSYKAVGGITFGVRRGNCFGLLGVNGAGKTTTFRLLSGDLPLIIGDVRIYANNKFIHLSTQFREVNIFIHGVSGNIAQIITTRNSTKGKMYFFLHEVSLQISFLRVTAINALHISKKMPLIDGYCPQNNAINNDLTARETLNFFAKIRGLSHQVSEEVSMWIEALGLSEKADEPCKYYSADKRKLCVGIALIGSPLVILLDEPTHGIDLISRKKIWNVFRTVLESDKNPCIVISTHNMIECETLCNSVGIMKKGQFECFGSLTKLRKLLGRGFTILLNLRSHIKYRSQMKSTLSLTDSPTFNNRDVDYLLHFQDDKEILDLMADFDVMYKGLYTLQDKHSGLLHYHIVSTSKQWSKLFREMEQLTKKHTIIEDYIIKETTIEEIFLSMVRNRTF